MAKEKKPKKEKGQEHKELSKEDKQLDADINKEVFIHSMPKRFFKATPIAKKSKGVGAFIILGGGIVLVAMLALVYYFVFMKTSDTPVIKKTPIVAEESKKDDKKAEPEKAKKEETKAEPEEEKKVVVVDKAEKPIKEATTTVDTTKKATTTVDTTNKATTTKKTVSAKVEPLETKLTKAKDSDGDGLLDAEEKLLLTKENVRDSDGDGYEDLAEFMNLYNPAGKGALMVNDNIEKYTNNQYGYYIYYPKSWQIDNIDGDTSVIFKASNNQFVQIIVQANKKDQSLEEWYKEQFSVVRIEQKQKIYKKGWLAIESADGLSTYLMSSRNGDIYVINYNIGLDNTLYYENIYKMMIKSMEETQ